MPKTVCKKFVLADNLTLAYQSEDLWEAETQLQHDVKVMNRYYTKWRLKLDLFKTVVSSFHLNNQQAHRMLNIHIDDLKLEHVFTPKILGVTFDRSCTFREHLEGKAKKLATRNNLLEQLAGSSWGANALTLRTAGLSLVFGSAEYCSPVWMSSIHCTKINVLLNRCMRIITGTIKPSTPTQWLPVLSNIAPPHLRRLQALLRCGGAIFDRTGSHCVAVGLIV